MGFPVKHIDFGGEKRPVKYGMNALAIINQTARELSIELSEIKESGENVDFGLVRGIVYAGLLEGARAEKKEFTLTPEDVGDFLDDDQDKSEEFMLQMLEQMPKSKKAIAPEGAV